MGLISNPTKILKIGTAFELEDNGILPQPNTVRGLLITRFLPISGTCQTKEGPFGYLNILGVTEAEILFVGETSPQILQKVLAEKDLDQLSKLNRKVLI